MRDEPNHGVIVALITAAALVFIVAITTAITVVDTNYREGASKTRCGIDGGKVEFYDAQHDDLWRCVKIAERSGT